MALHLHQMLCLKLSNAVVVVKSSAEQKGVDADNLTLHVQCFMHVREATGLSMRRQGRLYRPMKITMMKMMTIRYGTLLIIPVMRSTIKVYSYISKHSLDISKFDQHYVLLAYELYLKVH